MGQKCVGSFYGQEWQVYTREDAIACVNAGGAVVDDGSGPCAANNAAAMVAPTERPSRGPVALAPFREIRDRAARHPLVAAALELNEVAASTVEELGNADEQLRGEMVNAFVTLSGILSAVTSGEQPEGSFETATFERLEALGNRVAERSNDAKLREKVLQVLTAARPIVGRSFADIRRELIGVQEVPSQATVRHLLPSSDLLSSEGPSQTTGTRLYPSAAILRNRPDIVRISSFAPAHSLPAGIIEFAAAMRAIDDKARALGWVGRKTGDSVVVPGGWMQAYENADLYATGSGEAFEVHGDIRTKYNALGGAGGILGAPVTDELGTPDGVGRFNHFANNGSIYWTNATGPMAVYGRVRQEWAASGWEAGPMGYPVRDQQAMPPLNASVDHPNLGWCLFQNGAIMSIAGAGAAAVTAEVTPDDLKGFVRSFFDRAVHAADPDLGLEARVDLVSVSEWSYGFWAAIPRVVTVRLFGFHDNGVLPDTTFEIEIGLRFSTTWPMAFTYPATLTLIATLDHAHISTSGLGSGALYNGLHDGIERAFHRTTPDPAHPEVPDWSVFIATLPSGASQQGTGNLDVIDVMVNRAGGLSVLLNPLPPIAGNLRKTVAENQIRQFFGG